MPEYEIRDGVPYVVSKPLTAREAFDEKAPLSTSVLLALGWDWESAKRGDEARTEYFAQKRQEQNSAR